MENAMRVGEYLKQRLTDMSARHPEIGDVRGAGLYIGVELLRRGDGRRRQSAPRLSSTNCAIAGC